MKNGICCLCGNEAPIKGATLDEEGVLESELHGNETLAFVMDFHEAWGQPCDGIGSTPMALVDASQTAGRRQDASPSC